MYLIILGIAQESETCMFLMKCRGYVRSLELREKNTRFFIFGKLIVHYGDNRTALSKAV